MVLECRVVAYVVCSFFFFKQKTAYEMRISDWSSDVCSSDLRREGRGAAAEAGDEILFLQPVLRDLQARGAGAHRDMARQEAHRIDGHIFEFIGDDVARGGEGGEARFVVTCRLAVEIGRAHV